MKLKDFASSLVTLAGDINMALDLISQGILNCACGWHCKINDTVCQGTKWCALSCIVITHAKVCGTVVHMYEYAFKDSIEYFGKVSQSMLSWKSKKDTEVTDVALENSFLSINR